MEEKNRSGYHSLFWPILLIGVGVIWLLGSLNLLPVPSLRLLLRLWPLALIIIGLDIIIGRRSPIIGSIIGLGSIALIIGLLFLAPTLGFEPGGELKTLHFSEPLDSATSADVTLDLERYSTTIDSLSRSDMLIDAELDTVTDVDFSARGSQEKIVRLEPADDFGFFDFDWNDLDVRDARWKIGLSPEVPLDLYVDVGSGSAALHLMDLELASFEIDGGSGSSTLALPASPSEYSAVIDGGSGSFDIEIADGAEIAFAINIGSGSFNLLIGDRANIEAQIDGGSGSLTIDVPNNLGVRIVIRDSGSGSVHIPGNYTVVDDLGEDDRDIGIWESAGYDDATYRVEITFDPSSGSFTLR
ncbi:MAG: DUF5668 domain-containing protein [Anaerolineales bacterium]